MSITVRGGPTISKGSLVNKKGISGNARSSTKTASKQVSQRPEDIPGAVASTVVDGKAGVIVQNAPRTTQEAALQNPDIVASSRNPEVYLGTRGQRITPVATAKSGGTYVKTQEAPSQKAYTDTTRLRDVSRQVLEKDIATNPVGVINRARETATTAAGKPLVYAGSKALGAAARVESIEPSSRVGQDVAKRAVSTPLRVVGGGLVKYGTPKTVAGVTYGPIERAAFDYATFKVGSLVGSKVVGPAFDAAAAKAVSAGRLPVYNAVTKFGGYGLGALGAGTLAYEARYDPENVLSPTNVALGAGTLGLVKGVGPVGAVLEDIKFSGPRSAVVTRGNVGGGVEGVPVGTLQGTTVRSGEATFRLRGITRTASAEEFTGVKLIPLASGKDFVGVGYSEVSVVNPFSGRSIVGGERFSIAAQGKIIAGRGTAGTVFSAKTTTSKVLGVDYPERYSYSITSRAVNALPSGGEFNYRKLGSVTREISFQRTEFNPSKVFQSDLIDVTVPGGIRSSTPASRGEGLVGSYPGRIRSTGFYGEGVALLRKEGFVPPEKVPIGERLARSLPKIDYEPPRPLRTSRAGSLRLEAPELESVRRPRVRQPKLKLESFKGDIGALPEVSPELVLPRVSPRIVPFVIPSRGTRPSALPAPRSASLPRFNPPKLDVVPGQRLIALPSLDQRVAVLPDTRQVPFVVPDVRSVPRAAPVVTPIPEVPFVPVPPPLPPLPLAPVFGGGLFGGRRGFGVARKKSNRFIPSFTAAAFDIRTRKSQKAGGYSGLEVRPIEIPRIRSSRKI